MRQFYLNKVDINKPELTLPPEESKHACKVLRMVSGDRLSIVNGKGDELIAEIIREDSKNCVVRKISFRHEEEDSYEIHIAIAPTKMNDRFESFLEKATELGIHKITPLLCSNSERKKIKPDRYDKILIAAMKQSKRLYLPFLAPLTSFDEFIKKNPNGLIAHCYDGTKNEIQNFLKPKNSSILIGPEGDFTTLEVENALKQGFTPISLGKTRLRTETAGLYACALAKNLFE